MYFVENRRKLNSPNSEYFHRVIFHDYRVFRYSQKLYNFCVILWFSKASKEATTKQKTIPTVFKGDSGILNFSYTDYVSLHQMTFNTNNNTPIANIYTTMYNLHVHSRRLISHVRHTFDPQRLVEYLLMTSHFDHQNINVPFRQNDRW